MAPSVERVLRRAILGVLLLGISGASAELLLIGHVEDFNQLIPLALFAAALGLVVWFVLSRSRLALAAFQATMVLFVASGCLGVWLHFQANREFQLEVNPSLEGWALLVTALEATSPPALAPGMMVQLGLLGLAYSYRHPGTGASGPFRGVKS